ncbi:NADH-quinone oxidoreductase subunit C [Erythrobacteraceae bacterium CFH 75059]|uniref:NADH-quinone oxidoreductase subunit C n=1 Tax=Qipengyuania thermophila TaxID=2509361 RepID=UPI00101F4E3B|nr:NADH-quinone oxidoreductase subunit C [Qipengyuania thermophila]TCD05303.1 NADH-quinone oxidoreductase subunit C [Erythrobacteraceae bacterium CFH 75059]
MSAVLHSAPRVRTSAEALAELADSVAAHVLSTRFAHGEMVLEVRRESIADVLRVLRDRHEFQQLMEIAGVDFPSRRERFEVVYMLLSVTRNQRVLVKLRTDEVTPVPTVTTLWPNAGWLEREVFDLFGVVFAGNPDLRRILTDYGFEGHPFRKDFPLTGYIELRYSEDEKRVVYEPVRLTQDLRTFDFLSPWEGADYPLPGDEKATHPPVAEPKTTEQAGQTGAGRQADSKAAEPVAPAGFAPSSSTLGSGQPVPTETKVDEPSSPDPTEDRPSRPARAGSTAGTAPATKPDVSGAHGKEQGEGA